ncbi:MAG: Crp/Fnr family transcriptional regulator [Hyphomicrobiales bacterium]
MAKGQTVAGDDRKDIHNSEIPIVCRSCEARHRGICGALNPDQLIHLSKHTNKTDHTPDAELLAAGEESHHYSNVIKGVVKLTKLMADGRQQIVGLQFSPDFLGRPFRKQNDAYAEAANKVHLCSFPRNILDDMVKQSPELEHRLHEQALKQLDEARDLMLTLGRKTATEKVATFLHMIASHADPELDVDDGPIEFELPLKRADIADFLGLTIETVSRQMTKLRKAGIIDIKNNRLIHVPSLEALNDACEKL